MNNKVVVIIGASSGMGWECAKIFSENNYTVYSASRKECAIKDVKNIYVDASQVPLIRYGLKKIIETEGKIDVLIYVAGFSMASPLEYVKEDDYRYLFEVNLFGFMEASKLVIPLMKNQNYGKIFAISSLGGTIPIPYDSFYSASKAALDMFCLDLNIELEKYNISVTSVIMGGVKTDFTFKRRSYDSHEFASYQEMEEAVRELAIKEQEGLDAKEIAIRIFKIVESEKKVNYMIIGKKDKFYFYASNFIPRRLLLHLVRRAFKLKK